MNTKAQQMYDILVSIYGEQPPHTTGAAYVIFLETDDSDYHMDKHTLERFYKQNPTAKVLVTKKLTAWMRDNYPHCTNHSGGNLLRELFG